MYYAVILAGGSGTRLWPLSRQHYPKQALKLIGEKTMFQYAVERIAPLFPPDRIFVVTVAHHAAILQKQTPEIPTKNFILEPEGRGTASAIGLASIHLLAQDPKACMTILTADHFISETEHFCSVLTAAEIIARDGNLITLGIKSSTPSTGFGYIKQGALLGEENGFPYFAVEQFTEKPDLVTAQKMVKSGNYSWNSGMFIWQASTILQEFERQMPDFYSQLMRVKAVVGSAEYKTVIEQIWPGIVKNTIDYGIMEGAKNGIVIPVEIGWTDIGSWGSLFNLLPTDSENNTFIGQHISIDTRDTLAFGGKRLVATMGVQDLVIIDTDDVVMVCSRDREQDVKALVELLKKTGRSQYI
jgi:mannose-1-phosphate guanylyltransferase